MAGNEIRLLIERGVPKGLSTERSIRYLIILWNIIRCIVQISIKALQGVLRDNSCFGLQESELGGCVNKNGLCSKKELAEQYFDSLFDVSGGESVKELLKIGTGWGQ